jgi:hypothetical protein
VRIEGDRSAEEFLGVVERQGGPILDWIQDGGGVPQTDPGQTASATQNLAEGTISSSPSRPARVVSPPRPR